jgi:hypothetical protein
MSTHHSKEKGNNDIDAEKSEEWSKELNEIRLC